LNTTQKHKYSFFKLLQILSIDVVIGSLAVGYMATIILDVAANPVWWLILPMSVWIIYTLDHLVDGYKNKSYSVIERHRFHYEYRKLIIGFVMVISFIAIALSVLYLDWRIVIGGMILLIIIVFYLLVIFILKNRKTILLQKELIIAIVYTSGIFLAPAIWYGSIPSFPILCVIAIIGLLALTEGIMNSWFDYEYDIEDGYSSFTVLTGRKFTLSFLIATHMFIEAVILILLFTIPIDIVFWSLVILLIINVLLGVISLYPENYFFKKHHRTIGELTFILPILIILV